MRRPRLIALKIVSAIIVSLEEKPRLGPLQLAHRATPPFGQDRYDLSGDRATVWRSDVIYRPDDLDRSFQ